MNNQNDCCDEYAKTKGISRRNLIRGGALIGVTAGITSSLTFGDAFVTTAYAATNGNILVVLSMRGGADGLSLVVPHSEQVYYDARGASAIPKSKLLSANSTFGLHPEFAPLLPMWNSGKMAAVHAVGQKVTTRSHFTAMEEIEDADPGTTARIGWLNRILQATGSDSPMNAIDLGDSVLTTQWAGPKSALAVADIDALKLTSIGGTTYPEWRTQREQGLAKMWSTQDVIGKGVTSGLKVAKNFETISSTTSDKPSNGATYPVNSNLGKALGAAARIIRSQQGAQIITVDHGSWDHHTYLGDISAGNIKNNASELAKSLAAFFQDLGSLGDKVTVVTLTEFGRRVKLNGGGGLDHGHGSVMFALGAGVRGGYYASWPGLVDNSDADLNVTMDYRSVLSAVVKSRLPSASLPAVFPGFTPEAINLML